MEQNETLKKVWVETVNYLFFIDKTDFGLLLLFYGYINVADSQGWDKEGIIADKAMEKCLKFPNDRRVFSPLYHSDVLINVQHSLLIEIFNTS